jgi:hypothetical protein
VTIGEPTVVVADTGYAGKRRCCERLDGLGARLVIVDEPGHWPESLMADIAHLDPAAARVNALECHAGRFLVAFHNGDAAGFHASHQPAHLIGVRGLQAGLQEPRQDPVGEGQDHGAGCAAARILNRIGRPMVINRVGACTLGELLQDCLT